MCCWCYSTDAGPFRIPVGPIATLVAGRDELSTTKQVAQ